MPMTIDEAIGNLSIQLEVKTRLGKTCEHDAIRLGISALARIKTLRKENGAANYPLFGEMGNETLPVQGEPK